jgi:hypothetical protein
MSTGVAKKSERLQTPKLKDQGRIKFQVPRPVGEICLAFVPWSFLEI